VIIEAADWCSLVLFWAFEITAPTFGRVWEVGTVWQGNVILTSISCENQDVFVAFGPVDKSSGGFGRLERCNEREATLSVGPRAKGSADSQNLLRSD
jgi:hypothetical protein